MGRGLKGHTTASLFPAFAPCCGCSLMPQPNARDRFLDLLRSAVGACTFVKLTLGKPRGVDPTLKNLFVRPVSLKAGPHFTFVWRHATRDITKNHPPAEALQLLVPLIGADFLDAHLFTPTEIVQYETRSDGTGHIKIQ